MIHVKLPEEYAVGRRLPFYLAMEEYLARNFSGEYFFMWQVKPTVIFGRNQIIDAEVNLGYCRANGIDTCRRKSGGGCVYADMNNIMFSHITICNSVSTTFTAFTARVASMLQLMGVDARTTGRNDILIGDRKVSGYAFYHIPLTGGDSALSRAVVHGTMLHDADLESMTAALTPSTVKLKAKGVESVRSHVTTIREHSAVSLADFKAFAASTLCDSTITLTDADVKAIGLIAEPYYDPAWIYGRRLDAVAPDAALRCPRRVEGVGEFVVDMTVSDIHVPVVRSLDLKGDFFLTADLDILLGRLVGVELQREALSEALSGTDAGLTIAGLTNDRLVDLLLETGLS